MRSKLLAIILAVVIATSSGVAVTMFGSANDSQNNDGGIIDSYETIPVEKDLPSSQSQAVTAELFAYVSGTKTLPIVVVEGDTHSSELPDAHVSTFSDYISWVSRTVTDGKAQFGEIDFGCSALHVDTAGGHFVGRNLDYQGINCPMVVKCIPDGGYASIGITSKNMIFSESASLETMGSSYKLACAPMFIFDGMNEKGLTCSLLMVENDSGSLSKPNGLFSMGLMRYLLDYAKDLEEVKTIVNNIGFSSKFDSNDSMHIYVTDASGNAVALECINGQVYYTDTNYITNHYIKQDTGVKVTQDSRDRYDAMVGVISPLSIVTLEDCRDALSASRGAYPWVTVWSIVFDIDNLTLNVWYKTDYSVDPVVYDINEMVAYRDNKSFGSGEPVSCALA